MSVFFYLAVAMFPLILIYRSGKRGIAAASSVILIFFLINGRYITGDESVSWDTLFWATEFHYLKGMLQSGVFPVWNHYFNSGEPFFIYHQHYAMWQWFVFTALDYVIPAKPVALFNISFLSLFVFYNIGCWLVFQKMFKDTRVVVFAFIVSLLSISYVMHIQEFEPLHIIIYYPFIIFFFLEFVENRSPFGLLMTFALIGLAANAYVPNYGFTAVFVFFVSYFVFMDRKFINLRMDRKTILYGGIGLALMSAAVLPILVVYLKFDEFMSPMRIGLTDYMNPLQSVTGHHQEYKSLFSLFNISEYSLRRATLFVGIAPLTLAFAGALKSANRFRWTMLAAAIVLHFISLGRYSFFYQILHYVPTFSHIRNFVDFEVFVLFFIICLSGMGLEWIMGLERKERLQAYIIVGGGLALQLVLYGAVKFQEVRMGVGPVIPGAMHLTFFAVSAVSLFLIVKTFSKKSYWFFVLTLVMTLGVFQWYLGTLHLKKMRWSEDDREAQKLEEILKKPVNVKWEPFRQLTFNQTLKVIDGYNTFEPALNGIERSFIEPVERNLLINKRYYEMKSLRHYQYAYFGVDFPKMFLTANYRIVPEGGVLAEMKGGYDEYLYNKLVFFSKEDMDKDAKKPFAGLVRYAAAAKGAEAATPQIFSYSAPDAAGNNDGKAPNIELDDVRPEDLRLGDTFDGSADLLMNPDGTGDGAWRVMNAGSADAVDINIAEKGSLSIDMNSKDSNFYDSNFTGVYVYRELVGDFDVETHIAAANHDESNEFAGLLFRSPQASDRENWFTLQQGHSGGTKLLYAINTTDGTSAIATPPLEDTFFRVTRIGSVFTLFSKKERGDDWSVRGRYSRPDFSENIQAGLCAKTNNTTGTFNVKFDYFKYKRVRSFSIFEDKRVRVTGFDGNGLSAEVDSPTASYLVYIQNYDTDWKAFINGIESPITRVNYNFQAVKVPKGKSTVEFRYRSIYPYALGLHLASAASVISMMGIFFIRHGRDY